MSYLVGTSRTSELQGQIVRILAATFASALAASTILAFDAVAREGTFLAISVAFLLLPGFVGVCGLASIFVGIPTTILLHRLRIENLWTFVILGSVAGALIAALVFASAYRDTLVFYSVHGGVPGAIWGAVWWLADRRHTTDG